MTEDQLPVGPNSDGDHRMTRHDTGTSHVLGPVQGGARALALDYQADREDDEIDLLAYWHILRKRKLLVLGILSAMVALSILITLMTTPIYRASVLVELDKTGTQVMQIGRVQASDYGMWDPEFLQTQYELIKSRALAERVANELDLDQATLDSLYEPGWLGRMFALLSPRSKQDNKEQGEAQQRSREAQMMATAGLVRGGLSVDPVRESRLVRINYDSTVPGFSVRVANAIAEGFIASGLERRFGVTSYAKTYLEDQLKVTKAKLEESERKLVEFAQKENLVNTGEEGQSLAVQNLTQLNSALASAQDQRIRAQARWRQAASGAMPADMIGNSNIRPLQSQKAQLQSTYQQKLQTFKPDYPEMQQLKGQIDELDRQIAQEIGGVRASVKAEYDAAAAQEGMLKGQIAALRSEALDVDGRSIQYNILKREADTNRQLYDGLLQRYKEVGVASDVRANNVSIIDRAQNAWRIRPSLLRNLVLGLLLGGVLGVLAAFLREFLDDTLKTPLDVEQKLKLPVLGVIPKVGQKDSVRKVAADPQSAFSEAYRSVRTALQFATDRGVPRTLLITSTSPDEGKSTTAQALARNFAQLGKRVLLIEADLRNPSLGRTLGLRGTDIGLSNVLAGGCTLKDAIVRSDELGLDVLLAGPLPPNPAELLSGSKLVSMLTVVSELYDQVILDGPPVIGLADAPILANAADGTLLVINSGKTKINSARVALKRLLGARARIIGSLITKYDARAAGYQAGYDYHYQPGAHYAYGGKPRLTKG